MNRTGISGFPSSQRGVALVTGLVLLLVFTLVTTTALRKSSLDEKMAYNSREKDTSFQMAEAGLRGGEAFIDTAFAEPFAIGGSTAPTLPGEVYALNNTIITSLSGNDATWWSNTSNAVMVPVSTDLDGDTVDDVSIANDPSFVVERIGFVCDSLTCLSEPPPLVGRHFYRISASGVAGLASSQSIVQSTHTRRF